MNQSAFTTTPGGRRESWTRTLARFGAINPCGAERETPFGFRLAKMAPKAKKEGEVPGRWGLWGGVGSCRGVPRGAGGGGMGGSGVSGGVREGCAPVLGRGHVEVAGEACTSGPGPGV